MEFTKGPRVCRLRHRATKKRERAESVAEGKKGREEHAGRIYTEKRRDKTGGKRKEKRKKEKKEKKRKKKIVKETNIA